MKGPRDAKRYVALYWKGLKRVRWDDLMIFKWEKDRKWRKQNRRTRDGSHGTAASHIDH